jgi:tRNA threonylcarbamoyladenosine biosynthesis protein TsaE
MQKFTTKNSKETQKLGTILAKELRSGKIICLSGDLGAGKTTFTQGFLEGLNVKGPHTSPTFLVMKEYKIQDTRYEIQKAYHIDAYRINSKDIFNLGWEEIISNPQNIVIIEWADRIKDIIPKDALWIKFEWIDENIREINFS